jgi:hypothetical protein
LKEFFTPHLSFLVVCIFLLSWSNLHSQECGTILSEIPNLDPAEWQAYGNRWQHKREKIYIGITIHIVEEVFGASNITLEQLYRELDAVNLIYSGSGFEFFFCGSPRTIAGSKSIYTYQEAVDLLNRPYHVPGTINIFYLDEIGSQELSSFACGISTFPFNSSPPNRFIIMQKGCSTNGSTLAHEIGHFFGLLHTHETAVGLELVDGSNCTSAGDLICDTPADPNLAISGLRGCAYEAAFTDLNGDLYRPDPANIMSYAPASCRRRFTDEQNMAMHFWYDTELSYLLSECNQYPDYAIESPDNVRSIISGQNFDLTLKFEKEGSTPAEKLALEITLQSASDVVPFTILKDSILFDGDVNEFLQMVAVPIPLSTSTGEYVLTIILDPDGAILESDKRNNIVTVPIVIDNSRFADIALFPNPAKTYLRVFLRDNQSSGQVFIDVCDLYGRQYSSKKIFKNREELFVEIDLKALRYGTYYLTVTFSKTNKTQSYLFIKE